MDTPQIPSLTFFEDYRPTILAIDDAVVNLTLLSRGLEAQYRVLTADSGLRGLQIAAAEIPDVILLDVMMPEMDGFAVARQLALDPVLSNIPIFFLTALSDQESQLVGLELGAVDFLTKPFSLKILRKRIANVIERDQLRINAQQYQSVLKNLLSKQTGIRNILESVFNASSDALIVTNRSFKISRVNSHAEVLLQETENQLLETSFRRFGLCDVNQASLSLDDILLSQAPYEGQLTNPVFQNKWVSVQGRSFETAENENGYLFSLQDISLRRALENERRLAEEELALARQRELSVGASIQQSLLFGKPPTGLKGIAVACFTEASNGVDGDFYTFTELNDSCFEVLTGDVMGKGVTAALIAAGIKNTYYKTSTTLMNQRQGIAPPTPAEIINAMHAIITPELIRIDSFVTLCLVRVDRRANTVTWVNAGHTPTLLARGGDVGVMALLGENVPLGVMADEVYEEHITPVDVGDALLLYSDGISEATDPEKNEYGMARIQDILCQGQQIHSHPSVTLNSLRSELSRHTQHKKTADDSTAILIRICPVRSGARGSVQDRRAPEYLEIPRRLDQLGLLRQRIAQIAADQSEEFIHLLQLGAFEAATNIVRHASENLTNAPLTIAFSRSPQAICVELIYEGTPYTPPASPSPDFSGNSEGGFGLFIIENSVTEVTYYSPMPGMASIRLVKNFDSATAAQATP